MSLPSHRNPESNLSATSGGLPPRAGFSRCGGRASGCARRAALALFASIVPWMSTWHRLYWTDPTEPRWCCADRLGMCLRDNSQLASDHVPAVGQMVSRQWRASGTDHVGDATEMMQAVPA